MHEAWLSERALFLVATAADNVELSAIALREAVRRARLAGHSWESIAMALGVTRQAAWERWHFLDSVSE